MIGVLRASRAFIGKRSVLVKFCRDKVLVKFCLLGTRFSENDFCIPKYFWKMLCSKFCIPKTLFGKRFLQKLWKFSARNSFQVKFFEVQCSEFLRSEIPKTLFGKRFLQKFSKFSARNSFEVKFLKRW